MNRRIVVLFLVLLCIVMPVSFQAGVPSGLGVRWAFAQEGWREEFDTVCAKTDIAMTLSRDELSDLIGRCDRLKARIEAEDESTRKVYLRRLGMCQDLYRFVLESKPPGR